PRAWESSARRRMRVAFACFSPFPFRVDTAYETPLARALRSVSVWTYPNTFAETACIAVLEALAAGCFVVTSDLGGIPETAADFARLIPTYMGREKYLARFVKETVHVLQMLAKSRSAEVERHLRRQVAQVHAESTWAIQARKWVEWMSVRNR